MSPLSLLILLLSAYGLEVSIQPSYIRAPINTSVSFTVIVENGEGKVYTVEAFGPYLSWNRKEVWIGSEKREIPLEFFPKDTGKYTISVKVDSSSASAVADIYFSGGREDLAEKIRSLREKVKSEEEMKKLEEIEKLYNESKYEIVEIKIRELEKMMGEEEKEGSMALQILTLMVLIGIALFLIRLMPL